MNMATPVIGKWAAFALALALSIVVSWWIYARIEPVGRKVIRTLFLPAARFLPRTMTRYPAPAG